MSKKNITFDDFIELTSKKEHQLNKFSKDLTLLWVLLKQQKPDISDPHVFRAKWDVADLNNPTAVGIRFYSKICDFEIELREQNEKGTVEGSNFFIRNKNVSSDFLTGNFSTVRELLSNAIVKNNIVFLGRKEAKEYHLDRMKKPTLIDKVLNFLKYWFSY